MESSLTNYAALGQLIVTQLVTAPFPHPARADGHKYHEEFYSVAEHYFDSTVAIFVPRSFQAARSVDFVVHFHGWRHAVEGTLAEYQLVSQFAASGKNAILVVPQGPLNAPDSFGGKLEDPDGFKRFMAEVLATLQTNRVVAEHARVGKIILSGHSGGYEVMAAIVDRGGLSERIKEVWLFDALYAGTEQFVTWQKKNKGRLLNIYTDHGGTKQETEKMMADYQAKRRNFFAAEDTVITAKQLQKNKLVFLHSDMEHGDVMAKRGTFEQFLRTSCLKTK